MDGLHILLTGGHSGIGLGVTKKLLDGKNKLGLIIRSESRKQQIMAEFSEFPQERVNNIDFFFADLSDQEQVRAVAKDIKEKWTKIDRLFNNAAIVNGDRSTSKQGNEMHLEINALAPVILTQELKPLLLAAGDAKVITTVTGGMGGRQLRTDKILDENNNSGMSLYAQSKQAVMFLMNDMANDDSWHDVKFLSVNPGPNKTNMTQSGGTPLFIKLIARFFFSDPSVGTQRLYNAGFDKQFANANAVFLNDDTVVEIKHNMTAQQKDTLMKGIVA